MSNKTLRTSEQQNTISTVWLSQTRAGKPLWLVPVVARAPLQENWTKLTGVIHDSSGGQRDSFKNNFCASLPSFPILHIPSRTFLAQFVHYPYMRGFCLSRIKALHGFNNRALQSATWTRRESPGKSWICSQVRFLPLSAQHRPFKRNMATNGEEAVRSDPLQQSLPHRPASTMALAKEEGLAEGEKESSVPPQPEKKGANAATKSGKADKVSFQLKTPKGTRDCKNLRPQSSQHVALISN